MHSLLLFGKHENCELKKALSQSSISRVSGEDEFKKINAQLRYHFKIDPDLLSDEDWLKRWDELKFAIEEESKRNTF